MESLENAEYGADKVTLIVSLDNSGTNAVEEMVRTFNWSHGEKIIRTFPERQGLRKHILKCGDFVQDFDAVAVFEDDVIASPGFYSYMKETVEAYQNNMNIAGISLYNHLWNVHANKPFDPSYSGYDVYFLQFAQSWGQIWMKKQWLDFKEWYLKQNGEYKHNDQIPHGVTIWPETSWLKYHIKYCVENNKFFVYPYKSLSTCFSDVGEHMKEKDTHLQVMMLNTNKTGYSLPAFGSFEAVYYDAFFERIIRGGMIDSDIHYEDVCVDLYGMRENYAGKKYLLSIKNLPYEILKKYGVEIKPMEENVINNIPGDVIKLYDLTTQGSVHKDAADLAAFQYRFRLYGNTPYLVRCIGNRIKRKLKK